MIKKLSRKRSEGIKLSGTLHDFLLASASFELDQVNCKRHLTQPNAYTYILYRVCFVGKQQLLASIHSRVSPQDLDLKHGQTFDFSISQAYIKS